MNLLKYRSNKKSVHKNWLITTFFLVILIGGLTALAIVSSTKKPLQPLASILYKNTSQILKIPQKNKTLVILLPHQDDEMFLGGTVHRFVNRGYNVYSLIITDGSGSNARFVLNGTNRNGTPAYSVVKKKYLIPAQDGYKPLDKQAFSAARNREYFNSMKELGIPEQNIRFANPSGINGSQNAIYRDGSLTQELATTAIADLYHEVGDGIYMAVASDADENTYQNPDHLAIENALKHFPGISEKYYFGNKEYPGINVYLNPEELKTKQAALQSYQLWDPKNGRFAVGAHSVPDMLKFWNDSRIEYLLPDKYNQSNTIR